MRLLYELVIRLMTLGIRLAAPFHAKARMWADGRNRAPSPDGTGARRAMPTLPSEEGLAAGPKTLWVHAASLGEFEQGRPVIEAFREQFPGWRIVLTFFSPSGYEIRKNYPHADLVCYLPADTRRNARDFLDRIRPDAAIFVKYEFWANYLLELKNRRVPTLLVSALFRESQPFFRWYGGFWRSMLGCFTHFFVQNDTSAKLLQGIGLQNVTIAGDTRVDRVLRIAENAGENEVVAAFSRVAPPIGEDITAQTSPNKNAPFPSIPPNDQREASLLPTGGAGGGLLSTPSVLIAGSTWPPDETLLAGVLPTPVFEHFKLVIAPHDPSEKSVAHILAVLPATLAGKAVRYAAASTRTAAEASVLVIDNVGMLNTLYRYGSVAYIGGGFGKGIHNTLEPAAFGLPIIFGPKYAGFEEARQFVARGGAFPVRDGRELAAVLEKLQDPAFYRKASQSVRDYLQESKGATEKIMVFLKNRVG